MNEDNLHKQFYMSMDAYKEWIESYKKSTHVDAPKQAEALNDILASRIDLEPIQCIARNTTGVVIFEEKLPKVEFLKIFRDMFDHVELETETDSLLSFRVW